MKYMYKSVHRKPRKFIATLVAVIMLSGLAPGITFPVNAAADYEASNQTELQNALNSAVTGDVIALKNDIYITSALTIKASKTITISTADGNEYSIISSNAVRHLDISTANIAVDLTFDKVILDGGSYTTSTYGGIYLNSATATLTLNNPIIQNCYADSAGAGIYINSGTLIMNSGIVSGNTAHGNNQAGGGVFVKGTFYMHGGEISGNNAGGGGGGAGVCVYTAGKFIMGDPAGTTNPIISGNITSGFGGGVSLRASGATFTMYSGTINGNGYGTTTTTSGGGVYVIDGAIFKMYGGEISGNKATNGGGVFGVATGTITINKGTISGNTAATNGGGIYGNATIHNSIIRGNNAGNYGGGVFGATVIIDGGKIGGDTPEDGNTAVRGGGVSGTTINISGDTEIVYNIATSPSTGTVTYGGGIGGGGGVTLTVSGNVKIMNNKATNGGGIGFHNNSASTFTISDNVEINDNTATSIGGGIYIDGASSSSISKALNISGGTVRGNEAANGGGVHIGNYTKFNVNGGTISNNTATGNGGGVYVALNSILNIAGTGGTPYITDNSASGNGGGIYTANTAYSNLTTAENTIFRGNTAAAPYQPPANAASTYPNIGFSSVSISAHPLNNYDINNINTTTITGFTVDFDSNGGSPVESQTVDFGGKLTKPADPTKEGHTFAGWYIDNETFENTWDFENDIVTGDMTLYAKWTELSEPTVPSEPAKPVQPAEPTEPDVPQTGDNNMMPWVCLLFISIIILGFFSIRKILKNKV